MLIQARDILDPELTALVIAQQRERTEAGDPVEEPGAATRYLVAVVDGRAVACGAWRPLEPGAAELEQTYVRPAYRGRGITRHLVVALEEEIMADGRALVRPAQSVK